MKRLYGPRGMHNQLFINHNRTCRAGHFAGKRFRLRHSPEFVSRRSIVRHQIVVHIIPAVQNDSVTRDNGRCRIATKRFCQRKFLFPAHAAVMFEAHQPVRPKIGHHQITIARRGTAGGIERRMPFFKSPDGKIRLPVQRTGFNVAAHNRHRVVCAIEGRQKN